MRVLITGASGFVGVHLAEFLAQSGYEVLALDRQEFRGLKSIRVPPQFFCCDLLEAQSVTAVIQQAGPDAVIHLAGSWSANSLGELLHFNVLSTANLLDAIRKSSKAVQTILTGSSAMYGLTKTYEKVPVRETDPFLAVTPYGVSKAATDLMGYQFFIETGLPISRATLFNVIGPGQSTRFFCSEIASRVAKIKKAECEPVLQLRHWNSYRDFIDIRDVCAGYQAILEKGDPGEAYNLCSGRATHLKEVVQALVDIAGIEVQFQFSEGRLAPMDIPYQCGSYEKLKAKTGWEPNVSLQDSLAEIFQYQMGQE